MTKLHKYMIIFDRGEENPYDSVMSCCGVAKSPKEMKEICETLWKNNKWQVIEIKATRSTKFLGNKTIEEFYDRELKEIYKRTHHLK